MYHRKYVCLYGEHVQIFCLLGTTCIAERQKLTHNVSSAVNNWSLLHTCFGNVLLQEMCGPFAEERFRNALTMLKISSCYFVGSQINFHSWNWKYGRQLLGQFGMLEINFILNISKLTPTLYLMGQLDLQEYQRLVAAQTNN